MGTKNTGYTHVNKYASLERFSKQQPVLRGGSGISGWGWEGRDIQSCAGGQGGPLETLVGAGHSPDRGPGGEAPRKHHDFRFKGFDNHFSSMSRLIYFHQSTFF